MSRTNAPIAPTAAKPLKPLRGVRVLSLALNLPGPAALMRLKAMGANCLKAEPPGPKGAPAGTSGDPMGQYNPTAYAALHDRIKIITIDLKSDKGQARLHKELARTDVLLTSFRPSALTKLGLAWKGLRKAHPHLSMVAIVGAPGERAEEQVDGDFSRRVALITESLNSNAIDIARALSIEVTDTAWASYLRGDRGIFTRRAVRLLEPAEARDVAELYDANGDFREHVNRYIHDFESMLRQLLSTRDGNALGVTLLSSDMGKLYVALAQGIERLRT